MPDLNQGMIELKACVDSLYRCMHLLAKEWFDDLGYSL